MTLAWGCSLGSSERGRPADSACLLMRASNRHFLAAALPTFSSPVKILPSSHGMHSRFANVDEAVGKTDGFCSQCYSNVLCSGSTWRAKKGKLAGHGDCRLAGRPPSYRTSDAARRPGGQAARRPGGKVARWQGGKAARRQGGKASSQARPSCVSRSRFDLVGFS